LKHDKYIFDIPIPFCHPLYLSATLKQSFREFAVVDKVSETVYMSAPGGKEDDKKESEYQKYIYHASKGYQYYGKSGQDIKIKLF
jgi:hypothetical protein